MLSVSAIEQSHTWLPIEAVCIFELLNPNGAQVLLKYAHGIGGQGFLIHAAESTAAVLQACDRPLHLAPEPCNDLQESGFRACSPAGEATCAAEGAKQERTGGIRPCRR